MTALLTLAQRLGIDPGPLNQADLQEQVCSKALAQIEILTREREEALAHAERLRNYIKGPGEFSKDERKAVFSEQPPAALAALKAEYMARGVEAAITDYKREYMGQGVEILLQSFADSIRQRAREAGDARA